MNKEQLKNHVGKLNNLDLTFEWEIVLLNVFSKLGSVIHEPNFEDSNRKVDLFFTSNTNNQIEFLLDITTVSDSFAETENPVEYLHDKLLQIQSRKSLPGGFGFAIGGNAAEVTFLREKQKLNIPIKKKIDEEIFQDGKFKEFINEIVQEPLQRRELYINKDETQLKIFYSLNKNSFSTFPSYTEILSLEDNSIWKALVRKYKQLKETNYEGNIGIIVCDGDCESLRSFGASWYSKSSSDVIRHFLKKKSKVAFILTVYVKQSIDFSVTHEVVCKIYKGKSFDERLEDFFSFLIKNTEKLFPIPERNSANAMNFIKAKSLFQEKDSLHNGQNFFGGGVIKTNEIKISSRTLLELLAGKIDYEILSGLHKDFFKRKLIEGKLIDAVEIEKVSEKDDDWIILRFASQDVAISPFEVPDKHD